MTPKEDKKEEPQTSFKFFAPEKEEETPNEGSNNGGTPIFNTPLPTELFQDSIQNNKITETNIKPKYSLNESINLVRETLKKIEESGFKVDSEEVDLINNYQITIKISKENNEG